MASMTSMFTGLSGLATNARRLDVIGNNIANINTTAFKSNRAVFNPTFSRSFSMGTAPSATTGGGNPSQIGLGVTFAGTQRNFGNGAISPTGVTTDIAIEGDGFFIVRDGADRVYTRAGSFQRNQANELVTLTGGKVMGYGVDSQFQIVEGDLVDMVIPVGTLTLAQATQNVTFSGNLNASGTVATQGSSHASATMFSDAGMTNPMTGAENLTNAGTNLYIDDGSGGSVIAIEGGANTIITISGIEKAGKSLGTHTFGFMDATAAAAAGVDGFGSTINDYLAFLEQVLGLDDTVIDGLSLGGNVAIDNGQIVVTGNHGTVQDLSIASGNFTASSVGGGLTQPFSMSRTAVANGESVRTSFLVYDSLGSPITVDLTMVLQATEEGAGTTWQFLAESSENDAISRILGTGLLQFDANGKFLPPGTTDSISIARNNGAETTLNVSLLFDSGQNAVSGFTDTSSNLAAVFQDGSPIGTLSNFAIGGDGTIMGSFTNGLTRTIGRIALAKFINPEGLIDVGNNFFRTGPNSGNALVTSPTEFGTGRLLGGALELANVDLSEEFINMILASTGYSASSRIISTTNELLQQLMVLGR